MRTVAMLALVAFVLVAYGRTVTFGFVYDDHWTVVQNAKLDEPIFGLLKTVLAGAEARAIPDATRPAMIASLWLDRRLFGSWAGGYHAHSVLLYTLCCLLAAALVFAVSRRRAVATVAAIFFAAAPIHAEPVSAVNYREDLIAALGVLAALVFLFRRTVRSRPISLIAPTAFFALGLLGKESAVVLVALVLLLLAARRPSAEWLRTRENALLGLAAVLILWSNWRLALRLLGDAVPLAPSQGAWATLLDTARFEVRAVVSSLWPLGWSPEYPREGAASVLWLFALFAIIGGAVLLARRRSTRVAAIGFGWSMLAALPMSPLVGPANARADRYLFLSVLGGAMIWGVLVDQATQWLPPLARKVGLALAGALMLVFAWPAISIWRSDQTLWSAAVVHAPSSARAWTGLSRALRLSGELDRADEAVKLALELDPSFTYARVTKIYNRLARGDVEEARRELSIIDDNQLEHPGLARARRCAALSAREAPGCIRRD